MRTIREYQSFADTVLGAFVERLEVDDRSQSLDEILAAHPSLVVVLNHGPAHTPVVPIAGIARLFQEHGGAERRAVGITFRGLYRVPGLRQAVTQLTQLDAPPDFATLDGMLRDDEVDDVMLMPEGQNCIFGEADAVKGFLSPRFVELSIRHQRPILVATHWGTERWASSIEWPEELDSARDIISSFLPPSLAASLREQRSLIVPTSLRRLPVLRMTFEVVPPSIEADPFDALDQQERRDHLEREAARVHSLMSKAHDRLRARASASAEQ